jgi:hypothetical protein
MQGCVVSTLQVAVAGPVLAMSDARRAAGCWADAGTANDDNAVSKAAVNASAQAICLGSVLTVFPLFW